MTAVHEPIHPGEILLEEFMKPYGISQRAMADAIGVAPRRIGDIVHGKLPITAEIGLRLARAFTLSDAFFIDLQSAFDLEIARDRLVDILPAISVIPAVAAHIREYQQAS